MSLVEYWFKGFVMLQICSGKMFQRGIEYRNNLRGVLYTNLRLNRDKKLETDAGSLLSTSNLGQSNTIVYELEELIEGNGHIAGVLVSHGIGPYILDFSAIISFVLNCTASPSYTLTDRLLGEQHGISTHSTPKQIVKRVFDKDVFFNEKDEEHLLAFIKQLIGLKRNTYLGVMSSIRTYVTGMQRIADDFELAYTLLVASIESLAQNFDGHKASWLDYDQRKRRLIDSALVDADETTSEKVRAALLDIEHTSLSRRFRDFSLENIRPSYYREETVGVINPISRNDLAKALSNAYQARSQYIHNLRKLPDQLITTDSYTETCRINKKTWLTIQGLSRLARHVITEFIMQQPTVESEVYDYSLERSGIVQMPMAPQYWVGRANLYQGAGSMKLEGFLSQLSHRMAIDPKGVVTDLTELLTVVEGKINELKKDDKLSFIALYIIYNGLISESQRMENSDNFISAHEELLSDPSAEALIVNLILNVVPAWEMTTHYECLEKYFRERDNKLKFRCPKLFEAGIILQLAERYRSSGDYSTSIDLVEMAVENYPEHTSLRQFEIDFKLDNHPIEWTKVLLPKKEEPVNQ
ncbi:hypothetical protein [Pseudoalteromonas sp. T1lg24]|uniref:hypothetical protein n=1 Tax=Pseudoalteromonas sp. T1lg24 TaxID=2077099 RepID=UPI0018F86E0F|nr:hypothetical protein [Pseudoalteromonas sp. T1lg24]